LKTMDRPIKLLIFILLPILFFSSTGQSLMVKLSLESLSHDSDAVVLGKVEDIACQWSMDRSAIVTVVTMRIQSVIKGELLQSHILIQYPGGEVGDIGLRVSDMPEFRCGEQALVFLKSISKIDDAQNSPFIAMNFWPAYTVFGAAQGKYSVDDNGVARKKGYSLISDEPDPDRALVLENLMTRIRKIIRQLNTKQKRIREKR
jgi:hypothetical protein